jgi:hypothetical protein
MNDNSLRELELKTICPHADQWPTEFLHQQALVAAANTAVAFLREAYAQLDRIDQNHDLTPEAKQRRRAVIGGELITKLKTSKTLACAREAAERMLQKYEQKINSILQPATDPQSVGIHAQIRAQLLGMKDPQERTSFLQRNGTELTLISAALSAPPYLSGLTDAELALLRKNLENQVQPEVIAERDFVQKAMEEVERGWRAAKARIAKRGGLEAGDSPRQLAGANSA